VNLVFKLAQLLFEGLFFFNNRHVLALEIIKLALSLRDHLVCLLELAVVAGFVAFVALVETLAHLDLFFFDLQLHSCLHVEQFVLIAGLSFSQNAPLLSQFGFALILNLHDFLVVLGDKLLAPLDLPCELISQPADFFA